MKLTIFLTAIALIPGYAQIAPMKPAPPAASGAPMGGSIRTESAPVSLQVLQAAEKEINNRIATTGGPSQACNVLSPARGVYVSGLGAMFSAEVELTATPGGVGIFGPPPGPEQKARFRKDKLTNVPLLEKALSDLATSIAASPGLKLGENEHVVVAARLNYRVWEDTTGLPGQIVAHVDRRGGAVKVEIQ
ncbi:MAG: hypothetical protein WDO73_34140 [Ignavibacteriota bacterium]